MKTNRNVLFSHIPKTGGVTLRIILNRVYGTDKVFLINSTDIGGSLDLYSRLKAEEREGFTVVAGHGAELFSPFMNDPFRITILREPVSLFLSQYYYLKDRKDAGFYHEVNNLKTVEEYLDYAIEKGQDNLLTRYLSNSVQFLADPGQAIPNLRNEGKNLLARAKKALVEYDAVIDLADFDAGIFSLSAKLEWEKIPFYRPGNRNRNNPGLAGISKSYHKRLQEALQYDLALYEFFKQEGLGTGTDTDRKLISYRAFSLRQKGIKFIAKILNT